MNATHARDLLRDLARSTCMGLRSIRATNHPRADLDVLSHWLTSTSVSLALLEALVIEMEEQGADQ